MTPEAFVYWLQGVFEVTDPKTLDAKQVDIIKAHLALVLTKVTAEPNPKAPIITKEAEDRIRRAFRDSPWSREARIYC